ncbi:hypothetical protein OpiT1DRAFT_05193 [Opitutaceae bacterium TAV1]|nr:hypothetical protein OpiT1DRAFT_05193 [Opitutaceae bacterium TAV1]
MPTGDRSGIAERGGRIRFHMTDDPEAAAVRGELTLPFSLSTHNEQL